MTFTLPLFGACIFIILQISGLTAIKPVLEEGPSDTQSTKHRIQEIICDYVPDSGYDGLEEFGGSYYKFNNGSVRCTIEDDTNTLHCMANMQYVNVKDEYGNITSQLNVTGQGCWTQSKDAISGCDLNDRCSTMQRENKPERIGFCCCNEPRCNRKEYVQYLPYNGSSTLEIEVEKPVQDSNGTVIVIICVCSLALICVIVIVVFCIVRRRKEKATLLQLKMDQYNCERGIYSTEPPLVNYDDMKLETCLHRGRFGEVYKARLNDEGVCVKYFHAQQRSLFLTEKEIYSVLSSNVKTVVQCIACDERTHPDGSIQYIVIMEYVPLGSLASYLKTHTLTWREMCSMAQTAAAGIGYLHGEETTNGVHKHAIVHRDINSRNILVRSDKTCAIADMGFSMKIRGSMVTRNGTEEHAEDGSLRDVGTVRYMAPEILDCAVNLRDCESSLKQIDMYAFSLVLWELATRCKDMLFETKRFMLPFEEELGTHPGFESMRIHVAKEHKRPTFPVNVKMSEATKLLRETIEECWDTDAEARLTALCVEERYKEMESMMEHKCVPELKNETYGKLKRSSSSSVDMLYGDAQHELSPLLETDTPASEKSNGTTITYLQSPDLMKPDINIKKDQERILGPKIGRNVVTERNTMPSSDENLAVHENTLMSLQEAKRRQAAEQERSKRQWEEQQQMSNQMDHGNAQRVSRPPVRSVQLDVHNEVRDPAVQRVKENNLNVRRHNSQRNLNESSTSSNGGAGSIMTIPDVTCKPSRPKSLQLNIKPEGSQ